MDDEAADRDAIVLSETAAKELFGTTSIVGRRVRLTPGGRQAPSIKTVVGVSRNTDVVHFGSKNGGVAFLNLTEPYPRNMVLIAHSPGSPSTAAELLRNELQRLDPRIEIGVSGPATLLLTGPQMLVRFAALLTGGLALLSLVLSMVGLHGIVSMAAYSRSREIGVRLALGSPIRTIWCVVLGSALKPVSEGLAMGLVFGGLMRVAWIAFVAGSLGLVDLIFAVAVSVSTVLAALLAAYLPARRASHVDPCVVLRDV
jgi:hypothetical protein